jgi:glutamine amidotransferase PdxT
VKVGVLAVQGNFRELIDDARVRERFLELVREETDVRA